MDMHYRLVKGPEMIPVNNLAPAATVLYVKVQFMGLFYAVKTVM